MSDIVERLRRCADESWPYAQRISNTGHPDRDNNVGRAATAMREAADEIDHLRERLEALKEVARRLVAWSEEYPPGRVYPMHMGLKVEKAVQEIVADARTLTDQP